MEFDVSCPCAPAGSEADVACPLLVIAQLRFLRQAIFLAVNLIFRSFVPGYLPSGLGVELVELCAVIGDFGVLLGCS